MAKLDFQDNLFLLTESGSEMRHISGLFIFRKPTGAKRDYVSKLAQSLRDSTPIAKRFRQKVKYPEGSMQQEWVEDDNIDMDYHFRHYQLPAPGDNDSLMRLVNTIHASRMDLHRPLWEYYLIDGLAGGRFALLGKQHHASIDGAGSMRLMDDFFSESDEDMTLNAPWSEALNQERPRKTKPASEKTLEGIIKSAWKKSADLTKLGKTFQDHYLKAYRGQYNSSRLLLSAPRSLINGPLGLSRRVYMVSLPIAQLKALGSRYDCTINDLFLAISGSALRQYLDAQGELPKESLIGFAPVALKTKSTRSGNQLAAIHTPLGTDIEDPQARLQMIRARMNEEKQKYLSLSASSAKLYTNALSLPALGMLMTGLSSKIRPTFNLAISNVQGPKTVRYLCGAKLERFVPMSVLTEGSTVNITGISYAGQMQIAVLACPESLPNAETLIPHIENAFAELKR